MTSSSMPSALYRRASAAGSPAVRSPSKLMPLTTRPARTSRQAMIRLESTRRHRKKIAEDPQPHIARLFRMKLHAGHVPTLDNRGKAFAVLGNRDRVGRHRREVAVCEI